jgi:hypothetical protein
MDFLILALASTAGFYIASMFANTILGFIPSSFGGLSGATAGTAASPIVAAIANGLIIAAVIAAAGHMHGKLGSDVRAAV